MLCMLATQSLFAQQNANFDSQSELSIWQWLHEKQGYPSKLISAKVENGHLLFQPNTSAWYADFQAPYLFQTLRGNFDISARLKVRGIKSHLPKARWSLGGLMIRAANGTRRESWTSGKENWLFITTGVADPSDIAVFETKTTISSRSNLKLRPGKSAWVTLRIVRVDNTFVLLYKYDDGQWTILERYYRTDLPGTLQAGLIAYTDFYSAGSLTGNAREFNRAVIKSGNPDMIMEVDFIKIKTPDLSGLESLRKDDLQKLQHWTPGNLLSDYKLTNAEVLSLLGID